MGGLLGGVAGSCIGNKVFGQRHQAPQMDPGAGAAGGYAPPAADPYSTPDTGGTSAGADFDSGGGGGGYDSGGGFDAGGGDFGGGGDSGGGSDF